MDDTTQEPTDLALPPLIRLRVEMQALDPIRLPPYAGSAWRGVLGHGLRQAACVTRARTCAGCLLLEHCVYTRLFEPPAPAGKQDQRFAAPPRPYVLALDPRAPREYAPGSSLFLGMTLLGEALRQVPYLIHALQKAGQRGLGHNQARFTVARLVQEIQPGSGDWQPVYAAEEGRYTPLPLAAPQVPTAPDGPVRLRLLTPLRLKRHGHLTSPERFTAEDFLFSLVGRLRLLASQHGGNPDPLAWPLFYAPAKTVILSQPQLRWHEWTRFSSRQNTLMELGGLLGTFELSGPALAPLWPVLWWGQWVHTGKGTTFGLGAYRLEGRNCAPNSL